MTLRPKSVYKGSNPNNAYCPLHLGSDGSIWRGDLRTGEGSVVLSDAEGPLLGMNYDRRSGFLYTSGVFAGNLHTKPGVPVGYSLSVAEKYNKQHRWGRTQVATIDPSQINTSPLKATRRWSPSVTGTWPTPPTSLFEAHRVQAEPSSVPPYQT